VMRDKDARGILAELEPVIDEVVVTVSSSARAMDINDLAEAARDVFGEARLRVQRRLPDAIEAAIASAAEGATDPDRISGAGVVITGSVAMVGEARTLFGREPQ
jgi:dihydrofolate synthase/folylpolyglutamate synthase